MRTFQSFSTVAKETLSDLNEPLQQDKQENRKNSISNKHTPNYNEAEAFIEVDVVNPRIHGGGEGDEESSPSQQQQPKFTDYELITRTNLPQFPRSISHIRRRYSDFETFRRCLQREVNVTDRLMKVKIPSLPGKLIWQNRFDPAIIEQRRQDLQQWIRFIAGHPLIQTNSPALIRFLQQEQFAG